MSETFPLSDTHSAPVNQTITLYSGHLHRHVTVSVLLPEAAARQNGKLPLILFQDGQDFPALRLPETMEQLTREGSVPPLAIVGIHAAENRIYEYGVAVQADYMGRGSLAGAYTRFILDELLPHLYQHYPVARVRHTIAGFSLGGLMALDIAWNHPEHFSHTGVFSGSLWWRQRAFTDDYDDSDRIMHRQIRSAVAKPDLKFWFQTGTLDETSDRNNDGVIDSIEDSLDCIAELERKGYRWHRDVRYHEVAGGEHNPHTWARVLPAFLKWVFAR